MKFRARNYPNPLHHVTVKQHVVLKSGKRDQFMILYIKPLGADAPIVFHELFKYFARNASNSLSWQRHVARAIGLFYDFCLVKASAYKNDNSIADALRGFIECSLTGDEELGWTPSSQKTVMRNFAYIIDFSKDLSDHVSESLIPAKDSTNLRYFYHAYAIKDNVSLSHVTNVKNVAARVQATSNDHIYKFNGNPKSRNIHVFPEDLIEPLFKYGFKKRDGTEDVGAKMITAMLLFGGMRESEPFHVWYNDFKLDTSTGRVRINLHHPSEGATDVQPYPKMLRKEYLMHRKLQPRNERAVSKSYHAGWKDLAVNSDYKTEIVLIHTEIEQHFCDWFAEYLYLREVCMENYKQKHGHDHPFFFVKMGDKSDLGAPLSIRAYVRALQRAVGRLEKMGYMAEYGYEDGISPHPMRHWFVTTLANNGAGNKIIQILANHRNILSQEVYKGATAKDIDAALSEISTNYTIIL
ncbi:tyrosine-type recombinase/integrase [Vibrio sp. 10N.286.49.E11]|uniref:tyrosine-type recombinase/integrase n=1 Tax=Vibrio sp. 10N.286.49.E11 TaxID=3229703 RepID=UPI00354F1829